MTAGGQKIAPVITEVFWKAFYYKDAELCFVDCA